MEHICARIMRNMHKDHAQVGRIWLKTPALFTMPRCSGTTRKGCRCTITDTSKMRDNSGRQVSEPLKNVQK